MLTIADLIEEAETFEAKANYARGHAEKSRLAAVRHYQSGVAQTNEDAAKRMRALIAKYSPRPALRLVKEAADV